MYQHRLAYRHDTGEVEGFVGTAFDKGNARETAIRKIIRKCQDCQRPYRAEQVIESFDGLTTVESEQVKKDWVISARSQTT